MRKFTEFEEADFQVFRLKEAIRQFQEVATVLGRNHTAAYEARLDQMLDLLFKAMQKRDRLKKDLPE